MARIKEVLCMHHTHLDVGYTHVQPALLQLHMEYIDQAIALCEQTEDWAEASKFRWTCETTLPVMRWLDVADHKQIERFRHFLHNGQLGIAAQYFHGTPLSNAEQISRMLYPVRQLRERFGIKIEVSLNHDINGQPWPMSQILLDAGIKMHVMGINTHFGGFPLQRPYLFRWQTPDGRDILAFNGEIYVLFNRLLHPEINDFDYMKEALTRYLDKLEADGYPYDFIWMTATNPPLPDNNPPDPELADVIRRWNEQETDLKIHFATPEMLLERVERIPRDQIPLHTGDWTDYWNFGSGSAAKEVQLSRKVKRGLAAADFLEAVRGTPGPHYKKAALNAWESINLYDEHTWGRANTIEQPDRPDVAESIHHKAHWVYEASGLTTYLLGSQLEALAGNPLQSGAPEGILIFNPTPVAQLHELLIPREYLRQGRHLAAQRLEQVTISKDRDDRNAECVRYGAVELPPFSWKRIPLSELVPDPSPIEPMVQNTLSAGEGASVDSADPGPTNDQSIESPYYLLTYDPITGRITALWDKRHNRQIIDTASEFSFFQYVQETIDALKNAVSRKSFYSQERWNTAWKALRSGPSRLVSCHISGHGPNPSLILVWEAPGVQRLEQRITLYQDRAAVGLDAVFHKEDIRTPEGIYFSFPLRLEKGWNSHFDTAGMFVALDSEQLPGVSRDWVTVERTVSVHHNAFCVTLACPDAPLVQVGAFRFGKMSDQIQRDENPLLLAWPMNNYWDTNFRASQPGYHHFYYEMSSSAGFMPAQAYAAGILAERATMLTAAVNSPIRAEGSLFTVEGDDIAVLSVTPAQDSCGMILTVRNIGSGDRTLRCCMPDRQIKQAFLADTLQQDICELPLEDQAVVLNLGTGVQRQIRIIYESCQACVI